MIPDFAILSEADVRKLVMGSKSTLCDLDPIPTVLPNNVLL